MRTSSVPDFKLMLVAAIAIGIFGCANPDRDIPAVNGNANTGDSSGTDNNVAEISFKDDVVSNVNLPQSVEELSFIDTEGNRIAIADFKGKKNVVLVFTEGFNKMLCPFCKTQTSRLIANYDKFQALDTEILVVYPGETDHLDEFIESAGTIDKKQVDAVPFPIVLDQNFEAVDFFDIRSKLAHPSTYIINKAGSVVLAYVGADMTADRPSIKAMLEQVASKDRPVP